VTTYIRTRHNDYTAELVPKFEVFTDRIEITSAGIVHSGREQDDFFAGYSVPRNKTLMRVFKDLELVEYLGSGMPRILKIYPREAYEFSSRFIRTVFPVDPKALALERDGVGDLEGTSGKSSVESSVKTRVETQVETRVETRVEIIRLLKINPYMTLAEVAASIGKSTSAIERASAKLVSAGKLRHVGPKKGGHWEILTP